MKKKKKNEKKQGSMCFSFLFSLSRVKSPSFTPSPSHSPTPYPWLLLKTSSRMVTSFPGPTCDLRVKSQRWRRERGRTPRYQISAQHDRRVSTSWLLHFLCLFPQPPFSQAASPPTLDAEDSTTNNACGPDAESHRKQKTSFLVLAP